MNTKIYYQYRDADNYKFGGIVVVDGILGFEDIKSFLDDELFFIPEDVGLPAFHPVYTFKYDPRADHPWHELGDGDFMKTDDPPTLGITAEELKDRFREASSNNWPGQDRDCSWENPETAKGQRTIPVERRASLERKEKQRRNHE